jgi:hypothetical protein
MLNNIIKKGLGALQSLITKGFGGQPVIVSNAGGSISKLFPKKRHVLKKYEFNVDGIVAVKRIVVLFARGKSKQFYKFECSVFGIIKFIGFITFKVIAKVKNIAKYTANVLARNKHFSNFEFVLPKKYKVGEFVHVGFKGKSRFLNYLKNKCSGTKKFEFFNTTGFSGYRLNRLKREQSFNIKGRKSITKVLLSLGMFNKIPNN